MSLRTTLDKLKTADIHKYVQSGQEENIHLEFKVARSVDFASGDDRRNLASALSGFANSSGGILIWGVEARRNADGIDCAAELVPLSKPAVFLSRLNTLTGEATDPRVDGIFHKLLKEPDGTGFVATFVPESAGGPHMAKLGENRYYKRIGDGFYKMEHYDIADMFGRRQRPKLAVFYEVRGRGDSAQVHIGIRNDGRATARAPYLAFGDYKTLRRSRWGLDGNGNEGLGRLQGSSSELPNAYGAGMDFALHPKMEHRVACLSLGIPQKPLPSEDVKIQYGIACEDQPLEYGTITIPIAELV